MIEVEGNVTTERQPVRLAFLRKVVALHFGTVLLVGLLALGPMPALPVPAAVALFFASLLALSITRQVTKPRPIDQLYSVFISPVMFVALAMLAKGLLAIDWPVWIPLLGLTCGLAYTYLSGRDFSFVWLFILSAVLPTVLLLALPMWIPEGAERQFEGILWNAGFMLYFVYDLACLQSRRRKGE